jgi:hypothetical protein
MNKLKMIEIIREELDRLHLDEMDLMKTFIYGDDGDTAEIPPPKSTSEDDIDFKPADLEAMEADMEATRAADDRLPEGFKTEDVGTVSAGKHNFHQLRDGKNNFRGGLDERDFVKHNPGFVVTPQFFRDLKTVHGIENIITLNSDRNPGSVRHGRAAGLNVLNLPTGGGRTPDGRGTLDMDEEEWSRVKSMLESGNTFIHCTHGADRTGATVGRYYVESLGWNPDQALDDANVYKSGPFMKNMERFIRHGVESKSTRRDKEDSTVY